MQLSDLPALFITWLLQVYNWASAVLNQLLSSYLSEYPEARRAINALGDAFNLLVNLTVLYFLLKLASKVEKIIAAILIVGWGLFGLILLGLLNPSIAAKVSELLAKSLENITLPNTTMNQTWTPG